MLAEDISRVETRKGYQTAFETIRLLGRNGLGVLTETQENILTEGVGKGQLPGSDLETILGLINRSLEEILEERKRTKEIKVKK